MLDGTNRWGALGKVPLGEVADASFSRRIITTSKGVGSIRIVNKFYVREFLSGEWQIYGVAFSFQNCGAFLLLSLNTIKFGSI